MHRRERSTSTAERFLRFYRNRTGAEPRTFTARAMPEVKPRDTRTFREIVLEHVGRSPKPASEILRDVVDDYGSLTIRRFWRALRFWQAAGRIERTEDGYRLVSRQRVGGRT